MLWPCEETFAGNSSCYQDCWACLHCCSLAVTMINSKVVYEKPWCCLKLFTFLFSSKPRNYPTGETALFFSFLVIFWAILLILPERMEVVLKYLGGEEEAVQATSSFWYVPKAAVSLLFRQFRVLKPQFEFPSIQFCTACCGYIRLWFASLSMSIGTVSFEPANLIVIGLKRLMIMSHVYCWVKGGSFPCV